VGDKLYPVSLGMSYMAFCSIVSNSFAGLWLHGYMAVSLILGSLSLRFNGHFPGEPGLAGVY